MRVVFTYPYASVLARWGDEDEDLCNFLEHRGLWSPSWGYTDQYVHIAYVYRSGFDPRPMYDK